MIWIRADANNSIGLGHMMRCLSVAIQLKRLGQEVCFVLADASATALLEEKEQEYIVLNTDYRNMEEELSVLCPLLQEKGPDVLLVDSYFVMQEYLQQLRAYTKVAYMDDKAAFPYPVDMLINYNIYAKPSLYEGMGDANTEFLLGMKYIPLREEFQKVSYEVKPQVHKVLITTGGSDKYNLAGQILESVLQEPVTADLQYHVVSGVFNTNLPMLERLEREHANVRIHKNVQKMSALMQECDIALSAAGSTMYELCAVGVPTLCFSFVDNQEPMVEGFLKEEMVCYGGHFLEKKEALFSELTEKIKELVSDADERCRISSLGKTKIDGLGAERIARSISSQIEE